MHGMCYATIMFLPFEGYYQLQDMYVPLLWVMPLQRYVMITKMLFVHFIMKYKNSQ